MENQSRILQTVKELSNVAPEYIDYEDAYTIAMDEKYPIRFILTGTTKPFSNYKNKRPPTKKHYLFEYVISGKGYIYIGGGWQALEKGDMFIVGKNDERNFYSDPKDPMHKIWCGFSSDYIDTMLISYGISSGVYKADVLKYFERIYETAKGDTPEQEKILVVADSIHKIILKIASSKPLEKTLCYQIENELIASIYKNIGLNDVAAKLFISRAHLIKVFKQNKGITPYQFLLNEKVKIAKALLSTTGMSVKSISEKLCFADEHYFSTLFKQKTGLSPLQYKAKKRNG